MALGQWLRNQGLFFCLRLRRNEYIRQSSQITQQLSQLGIKPGMSLFFPDVNVTKQQGFGMFNVACKWQRNYRTQLISEGWFLLTNLATLPLAIAAYQQRSGIEAMFKNYKSGGYSLEGCHANQARLSNIVLLQTLAYLQAIIQGVDIRTSKVEHYVCRPKEDKRKQRLHSNFWVGLYGYTWLMTIDLSVDWLTQSMHLNRNKRLYHQRALQAIDLIQPTF